MEISTGNLSALVTASDLRLQSVWDKTVNFMDKVGTTIPCPSTTMLMPWLQIFPQLREWFGDRKFNNYVANNLAFTPLLWELSMEISRSELEDDMHGIWLSMGPERISREVKLQPDKLVSELLESNPATFDGVDFFSASHPVDFSNPNSPTTNSNVLLNSALSADNVQALRAQMTLLQGPDGIPLNFVPNVIMVPPALEGLAKQIANAEFYPTGLNYSSPGVTPGVAAGPVSNVYKGLYEVVVNPYLTSTTRWYLLCTSTGVSPLAWIERVPPQISYQVNPEDFMVFNRDKFAIGVRRRGVAGLTLYYLAGLGTADSSIPAITPASQLNT
jgi:phage major head subunit gpT-like protein